ncbi:endolytic transglycosylase MltG [bacterium]|nr:endolytic transglycosylase MltG [bacterium]
MKKVFIFLLIVLLGGGGYGFYRFQEFKTFQTMPYQLKAPITITITADDNWKKIAAKLENENVISNAQYFYWMIRHRKMGGQLKKGEFEFAGIMTPRDVVKVIASGKVKLYSVTIPEGYNMWDIAALLKNNQDIENSDKFLEYCTDKKFVKKLWKFQGNPPSCDGILFPSTYRFPKGYELKKLMKQMASQMTTILNGYKKEMKRWNLSPYEVVKLASVIEKETGAKEEQPLIGSVFHNRIKRGMKLQSDPTVIYGLLPKFNGNIRRKDLLHDHKWSTYTRMGLPFTPICMPSRRAVKSVLYPSTSSYLYFVATNKGRHYFSKSLVEHNAAVDHYQIKGRKSPFHWQR